MQPNHEEITRILADAQAHLRGVLASLAGVNATPNTLSAVTEAIQNLNRAFYEQNINPDLRLVGAAVCSNSASDSWVDPVQAQFDEMNKAITGINQRLESLLEPKEIQILTK